MTTPSSRIAEVFEDPSHHGESVFSRDVRHLDFQIHRDAPILAIRRLYPETRAEFHDLSSPQVPLLHPVVHSLPYPVFSPLSFKDEEFLLQAPGCLSSFPPEGQLPLKPFAMLGAGEGEKLLGVKKGKSRILEEFFLTLKNDNPEKDVFPGAVKCGNGVFLSPPDPLWADDEKAKR